MYSWRSRELYSVLLLRSNTTLIALPGMILMAFRYMKLIVRRKQGKRHSRDAQRADTMFLFSPHDQFHNTKAHENHPGQAIKVVFDRNSKTEYNSRSSTNTSPKKPRRRVLNFPARPSSRHERMSGASCGPLVREVMKFFRWQSIQ